MVDRCICYDKTFAEMKLVIDEHGLNSFDELKNHITFAENCRLCVPYVELVIKTGKTKFEVISGE